MDLYHYMPCKADSGGLGSDILPLKCQKGMHASAADIIKSLVAEAGTLLLCGDGDTHAANNNRRSEGNLVREASAL